MDGLDQGDPAELAPRLVPGGPADVANELIGVFAVAALAGLHLPVEKLHISRFRAEEREADIEVVMRVAAQEPWDFTCTFTLRLYRSQWRLWTLLPTPLGGSLEDDGLALDDLLVDLLSGSAHLKLNPTAPRDEIERLALTGMEAHGVPYIEQVNGVRIWRDFVKKRHPSLERPAGWAAALDYIMALMEYRKGSQGEIGKSYGVSAATVAARYKEIVAALNLVQFDDRYSLMPQSKSESFRTSRALGVPAHQLRMPLGGGRGKGFFGP